MEQVAASAPKPRWKLFLGIGCLGLLAFVAILFWFVFSITGPVVGGADAFMGAIRDGRYEQAYEQAAPSLQQELGSAEAFAAGIASYRPREWSWSQRQLRNSVGNVSGSVTWQNGNNGTAEIQLNQINGAWRVVAFRFN